MKAHHAALWLVVVAACGGSSVAPHHPSAATYETAAEREEREAAEHRAQYRADAMTTRQVCPASRNDTSGACWTADSNPTARHLDEAAGHRKEAAKLRALSQSMRDAEARACAGLSEHDRDTSPFSHAEDIVNVEPLDVPVARGPELTRQGVVITFRTVPGLTIERLKHIVSCHVARNDAAGHASPDMPYCPLVPQNVTAEVKPSVLGFAVEIRSNDAGSVVDVLRRAELLQLRRHELLEKAR